MIRNNQHRVTALAAFLAFVACVSVVVWMAGMRSALDQIERRGQSDLALASDRLTGELQDFRNLAVLSAVHPDIKAALIGRKDVTDTLVEMSYKTSALNIVVIDKNGTELAAATEGAPRNHTGEVGFERAMDGALGVEHRLSTRYGQRIFIYTAPVFGDEGPVIGAVAVTVNVNAIEANWRGDRPAVFFTDKFDVVFISNRSELVFRSRGMQSAETGAPPPYPVGPTQPFFDFQSSYLAGYEVWNIDGGRYLPQRAMHLTLELPVIGLTGEVLVDIAPARQLAFLQAAIAAATLLGFGAILFLATERRRTLAEANALLEGRVARRTAELQALNADLRREVAERTAAEARLKRAQQDLVQAGKLSALGEMSAGISHELNQPLMAIRSFSENAEAFLERGKSEMAAQNLSRISELARRMGRIIRNLRAFARQEDEPLKTVDLSAAIDGAVEMSLPKARQEGATVHWENPSAVINVRGGEVRLQQVVMNLISNAIDAMEGQDTKEVFVNVTQSGGRAVLTVRDAGPGIAELEKIFDPFYTTKQVGSAEGMGLGLSISYGLVQSFGGAIQGRNHPSGGAEFTIELDIVTKEAAE